MPTDAAQLVKDFYAQIWNQHDHQAIARLLHPDVCFRGSLGRETRGHTGFADYLNAVHAALANYRCTINDLVCEPPKVFARMAFTGRHRGELLGYPPSDREVSWQGAALFTITQDRIIDIWVLGDLQSLVQQLGNQTPPTPSITSVSGRSAESSD